MVNNIFSKKRGYFTKDKTLKKTVGKKKKKETIGSFYGTDDFDFGDDADSDDLYGAAGFSKPKEDQTPKKVTLQSLFEFKIWEIGVLVVELLMVIYLILVLLKIVPLF